MKARSDHPPGHMHKKSDYSRSDSISEHALRQGCMMKTTSPRLEISEAVNTAFRCWQPIEICLSEIALKC